MKQNESIRMRVENIRTVGFRAAFARFRREEEGSAIIFGLFCFLTMLFVAGVAIDVMRYEAERSKLQNVLDRAILASTDLENGLNPEDVLRDYFAKDGYDPDQLTINVSPPKPGFRRVTASVGLSMPTIFMRLVGVPDLNAPVGSSAQEGIGNVEISLVLDVSGSMRSGLSGTSNSKIDELKIAAENFVDTMFRNVQDGAPAGTLSISVIPYSQQVTVPPSLATHLNFSGEQAVTFCADFRGTEFNSTAIDENTPLTQSAYVDLRSNRNTKAINTSAASNLIECAPKLDRRMLPFASNETALKTMIQNLSAGSGSGGWTAIDIGTKWGAALLDPAAKSVVGDMILDGNVEASLAGRPFAYQTATATNTPITETSMKVLVVMTDGKNTDTYMMKGAKAGESKLVKGDDDKYYYYKPERSGDNDFLDANDANSWRKLDDIGGAYTEMTLQEVWATMPFKRYARLRGKAGDGDENAYYNANVDRYNTGPKNGNTNAICSATKDKNVFVFTIAFEAPAEAKTLLKNCATNNDTALIANGAGSLDNAFDSIANAINKLRLTN